MKSFVQKAPNIQIHLYGRAEQELHIHFQAKYASESFHQNAFYNGDN